MTHSNDRPKTTPTRRAFVRSVAGGAAALAGAPYVITGAALGNDERAPASERITMGIIGFGGRAQHVSEAFMWNPDVQMVAVCDVKRPRRELGKAKVDAKYGNKDCAVYRDLRELLARPDIDAVLIATGDNWHSMASILAARAGKDMYCEKPLSVTAHESRAVARTMKQLGRVFQCGMQRRSISHFRFAVDLAHSGKLGKLTAVHAESAPWWLETYQNLLPEQPLPDREDFDWNLWLGPALWRPYNGQYAERGFWGGHLDFAGGSITEWGSHTADLCNWAAVNDTTTPVEYWPEENNVYVGRYANGVKIVFRQPIGRGSCAVRFEGEEGWVETDDSGQVSLYPESLLQERRFKAGYPVDNHVRAFLDAVKSRKDTIANADVAHRSITVCHLANISRRLNRAVRWDPESEVCPGDDAAQRLISRAYRAPWQL